MDYFLDALKWSIVAGAAVLALAALKPVLDKRYRARWRCWVWLALAALLLLAPVQWERLVPAAEGVTPPVVVEVPYRQVTVGDLTGIRAQTYRGGQDPNKVLSPNRGEIGLFDASAPEDLAQAYRTVGVTITAETILTALWLAGMVCFALYHLVGTAWFSRRARRWSRTPGADTAAAYEAVCREMGLRRRPVLLVSSAAGSPMMIGLLHPRLLLPEEDYGRRELDFILLHELTHYRRHDLWYKLLLLSANAVHWFNPLVYLLVREAGADLELTCDDAVMAGADTETRRAYTETLLAGLHRQSGLSRAALSTHFYGGARVMKARFRNILSGSGRKKGAVALVLVLVLTLAAACSVGLKQTEVPEAEPLTEEELADWQEKLSSAELNGFVSRLYTDVRYLPLGELFYNYQDVQADGSILTHTPENAGDIYETAFGFRPDCGYTGITRTLAEEFLQEYTGYTVKDFRGGFGSQWLYDEGSDSWFFAHGDTNYCFVNVLSGTKSGDTVTLELELPGGSASGGAAGGTMTIEDGKFRSFTNPLYTAVEAKAWDIVDSAARSMESGDWIIPGEGETVPEGPKIVDSYISGLWSFSDYKMGDKTYSGWNLEYRLRPDDISKVVLAGGMSETNGWVTETSSMGSPVIIVSVDEDGNAALEEVTYDSVCWEMGYTWEEYITCHTHLGMDIGYRMDGWPELTTPFLTELLEGRSTWAADWQDVALSYLNQAGQYPSAQDLTLVREFEITTVDGCDQSLLVEAKCGEETVTLFLSHILYPLESWNSTAAFWMVNGALWPDGAGGSPDGEGGELLYTAGFQGERPGAVYLYGARGADRCRVSQVEVAWSGGGVTSLDVAGAVQNQWGDSTDSSTECWDETGGLLLEDFNFDGYTDIALQGWITASNLPRYLWLYDPQTGSFQYALCLNGELELDSMFATVTATSVDQGGAVRYQEHYRPDEAGMLYLTRRDILRYENGEYILSSSETYDRDGNLTATGEALLHETDFTLTEGKTGTLRLYGRKGEYSGCGVSRAELTWDGDGGGTAFYTREAIVDQWGEDSVYYYTLAGSEDGGLRMEDVNFDGYTDICLQVDCSAAYNWSGAWWLYDPETETFRYAFSLGWDVTIDREAQQLTYEFNGGSWDAHYRYTYAYRPDGSLFLTHWERFDITTGEILEVHDGPEAAKE